MSNRLKSIFVEEYVDALKKHYPNLQWTKGATETLAESTFDVGGENRFVKPSQRPNGAVSGWSTSQRWPGLGKKTVSSTYKGLLCHKAAVDLKLYSALIWELKPRTIIEFGSFHGGSGIWFADQMTAMCETGDVHSFELLAECISPRAKHPRLHFHKSDLMKLETFDVGLLTTLPHPWLIIDDAHVNVLNVLAFSRRFMQKGDYFVKEDLDIVGTMGEVTEYMQLAESLGFMVDSLICDACGINHTCSPNSWFVVQSEPASVGVPTQEFRQLHWEAVE